MHATAPPPTPSLPAARQRRRGFLARHATSEATHARRIKAHTARVCPSPPVVCCGVCVFPSFRPITLPRCRRAHRGALHCSPPAALLAATLERAKRQRAREGPQSMRAGGAMVSVGDSPRVRRLRVGWMCSRCRWSHSPPTRQGHLGVLAALAGVASALPRWLAAHAVSASSSSPPSSGPPTPRSAEQ
jgi:hypothetical protein